MLLGLWDLFYTSDAGISQSGGQMLLLTSVRSPLREPDPDINTIRTLCSVQKPDAPYMRGMMVFIYMRWKG